MGPTISLGKILNGVIPPPSYSREDPYYSSTPLEPHFQARRRRATKRIVLGILLFTGIFVLFSPRVRPTTRHVLHKVAGKLPTGLYGGSRRKGAGGRILDSQYYVRGPPTAKYKDNLKSDVQYVTAWNYGGFTNDFMVFCNLIYLAKISNRVPILAPLLPSEPHLGPGGLAIEFGDVFDLPRLSQSIDTPVVEWSEVKQAHYGQALLAEDKRQHPGDDETLGCWSIWQAYDTSNIPFGRTTPHFLHLDLYYTAVPESTRLHKTTKDDPHCSFSGLQDLLSPEGHEVALSNAKSQPTLPNTQLACFDILYWVGEKRSWEWEGRSPVWDIVAKNTFFTQKVHDLGMEYLRKVLKVSAGQMLPPFVSVHVRHGDFAEQCEKIPVKDCFAPLSAYARRIRQVQGDLVQIHGLQSPLSEVSTVIVTGDEGDEAWWAKVRALGWLTTREFKEEIDAKYGKWYSTIIDSVIQSKGVGFVGTAGSTMSLIAARRVEDWNHGPTRMVMWGAPGADDSE